MMQPPYHLAGVRSRTLATARGQMHLLEAGDPQHEPLLLVHGNIAAATFWEEAMLALAGSYYTLAPDLRGFGQAEPLPVDATRGMRDFSDDLHALLNALGRDHVHLAGNSLGGCVAMQYTIDHPQRVRSLSLIAPGAPFGFGGTRDTRGTPCWPDYAGSGGGLVNPAWLAALEMGDWGSESPFSPRRTLRERLARRQLPRAREDALVAAILAMATGPSNYSRDLALSTNWPGFGPGTRGVNNALSPRYCNLSALADIRPQPPIYWLWGTEDQVVADRAMSDIGTLGLLGIVPNYPGEAVFPPQPMLSQTRALLHAYAANGGTFREVVLEGIGHVPFLEDPARCIEAWLPCLRAAAP